MEYTYQEYPKWVKDSQGDPVLVHREQEEASLTAEKKDAPQDDSKEASKEELIDAAVELGITVDARWGVKRLSQEIAKAQ
jgi:hypothetical protein